MKADTLLYVLMLVCVCVCVPVCVSGVAGPRYRAVGRAMVKCLLEGRRIGSRLAPSVFKFITGTDTTLRDLQASVLRAERMVSLGDVVSTMPSARSRGLCVSKGGPVVAAHEASLVVLRR